MLDLTFIKLHLLQLEKTKLKKQCLQATKSIKRIYLITKVISLIDIFSANKLV